MRRGAASRATALVDTEVAEGRTRWCIRCGEAPDDAGEDRPIGSRLWLYTNFDCNLQCDYCCVRSSPKAPRRALGLARVRRIAPRQPSCGVKEIFVTGGEPFMLPDIGEILLACAAAAPTTVLTNGMLFSAAARNAALAAARALTLQISLDSPTPSDTTAIAERAPGRAPGRASSAPAPKGFACDLAATVSSDAEAEEFRRFLDAQQIAEEDRVIRRIALRGFAEEGIALARADLVPGNHDHGRRRLLASGRGGGRRPAWSPARFFRSPKRLPRCAAPSIANARISAAWRAIFNCA